MLDSDFNYIGIEESLSYSSEEKLEFNINNIDEK